MPILLSLLVLLLGCAAPHDNPLDPKSDRYVVPQPAPYAPDFSAEVWSQHARASQFSESYQLFVAFHNPDTTFALDSVWMVYNGWMPLDLRWDSSATWANNWDNSVFGCGQQMACVIGVPFEFYARDHEHRAFHVGPRYLFRVISTVPTTVEPDSFDTVGPTGLALEWDHYTSAFGNDWGFRAGLMDNRDSTFWTSSLLARDQLVAYPAPDSLADGTYYWTISVVDSFGNLARSQKAYFYVLYGEHPQ